MPSLRVVCLSTFLSICSTLTTLFHLFFSFLPPVVCSVRLKCRLLCKLVPYIRNRSLSLVPLGEARSQRKHVRRYISVLSLLREGEGERERVGGRERERERKADREYERGLRAHFGGRCGRFDFSHSLPLLRAHRRASAPSHVYERK